MSNLVGKQFIVTLQITTDPSRVVSPDQWNWDRLINDEAGKHPTPVKVLAVSPYPIDKEKQH